ncbi:MAG: dihydropteroate synthase [Coriobacteriales bacterium]|nr:dihydropteroate synthase [Coriobacteriales bacterium]
MFSKSSTDIPVYWKTAVGELSLARPLIMGILNVTPDSFSDGGRFKGDRVALGHARQMRIAGADIIDIGGESTRPGAEEVTEEEELDRVLPVLRTLVEERTVVSVDTRHASVAKACIEHGAAIINDVSGFRDQAMVDTLVQSSAGCVIMHMLGEPKLMQENPQYDDVAAEISEYLVVQAAKLEAAGITRDRICIDPGPGFGKTIDHNIALLKATKELSSFGYPLMAAYSRKAFLGHLTGVTEASRRLAGSVTVAAWAAAQGARILRVHDVRETVQALQILGALGYWS